MRRLTNRELDQLVDFGVAKAADQLHLTTTQTVFGKFAYMAPEQLTGEPVDRRADVWSLGVILWEILTSQRLFRRSVQAATADAVLNDVVVAPSRATGNRALESLDGPVLKALSKDPSDRYATAWHFAEAIDAAGFATTPRDMLGTFMRRQFTEAHAEMTGFAHAARVMPAAPKPMPRSSATAQLVNIDPPPSGGRSVTAPLAMISVAALLVALVGVFAWRAGQPLVHSAADRTPAAAASPVRVLAEPNASSLQLPPTPPDHHGPAADRSPSPAKPPATTGRPGPAKIAADRTPPPRPRPTKSRGRPTTPVRRRRVPAPSPPPSEAPHEARQGTLNVSTPGGWADVYVDGQHKGRTPLQISIPFGRRQVEIRPFGRRSATGVQPRRTVVVNGAGISRLVVPIKVPASDSPR